ncbi:MerR family transcriptional regulator [Pullulanibacillus sp. KACC 23026]|uniref:MerR family transcriptional regulator n=1 Tax=Pullulanibacillus sp. KACC 23026 TaxID=3028315 RepID=UPI0023B1306B|nr:MerR family transcriptional regulator [Pullulanibacillus sp. KACC 23026]WEG14583.1 MerR family transcriptional regulator [Pullulanibacillus sp. KACC 23026]
MKIKELAEMTRLTTYTIRYYEKEGLLDSRHFQRDENNYRNYNEKAIERLKLIKKFQSVGCSLNELKEIFQERDAHSSTSLEAIEWIRQKIREIERKKNEYDQIIGKLNWMLEYKLALVNDPQRATAMLIDPPFD